MPPQILDQQYPAYMETPWGHLEFGILMNTPLETATLYTNHDNVDQVMNHCFKMFCPAICQTI